MPPSARERAPSPSVKNSGSYSGLYPLRVLRLRQMTPERRRPLPIFASERHRIEPVEPRMRPDRNLAQRRPWSCFPAGVDRRRGLRADREFRGVGVVEDDLRRVLALRDGRRARLVFGDLVARQILPFAVGPPDAVHLAGEYLTGIEVERHFDWLAGLDVFEVLLEVGGEQVAIGVRDQGRDAADALDARHHARADLEVDDAAVLGSDQRRVVEV